MNTNSGWLWFGVLGQLLGGAGGRGSPSITGNACCPGWGGGVMCNGCVIQSHMCQVHKNEYLDEDEILTFVHLFQQKKAKVMLIAVNSREAHSIIKQKKII